MVTGAYFPEISSGGLQVQLMAQALRNAAEIRVLTTAVDPATPRRSEVDGVEVTRIHIRVTSPLSRLRALWRMTASLWRLIRWCDVVHIHGVSSKNVVVTAIARIVTRPIVVSLHTMGADSPEPVKRRGRLSWWAFRSASRYLAVSPALMRAMSDARLPAHRVALVPNGIDTTRFRPAAPAERHELKQAAGLAAEAPVILFVGFFSHDKQPRVLFDAWLRLFHEHGIDATACFVGATKSDYAEVDPAIADGMRRDATARGRVDRLTLAGQVHDIDRYYRLADVFVLPSRREGLPVALMEAMACALPCVASHLPGATTALITDRVSGRLTPVGDVAEFTKAIAETLLDPARAESMGAAARQIIVDRFSRELISRQWLECYHSV